MEETNRDLQNIDEEILIDMAEFFKVFGDSTRIRILYALFARELSVTEISDSLGMQISAVSHQLRILKQAKLVRSRRQGKTVIYALADHHVKIIIGMAKEHLEEDKMKKTYKVENLDCANCAAKMEYAIQKLDGVESATMSFMTQKLILTLSEGADEASVLAKVQKCCSRVDRDCRVIVP